MIKAVLWDFGGVFTTSPFEAFTRYEQEHELPTDFIRRVNSTNPDLNAWARLESNQISAIDFDAEFAAESRAHGFEVRGSEVLALLAGDLRPEVITAFNIINDKYKTACLTNNIRRDDDAPPVDQNRADAFQRVMDSFDAVIESSKVGIRKPNPEFYLLACGHLDVEPAEAIFLDDLGINLKPARTLGMTTIKVLSAAQAISELESHLDLDLTAP